MINTNRSLFFSICLKEPEKGFDSEYHHGIFKLSCEVHGNSVVHPEKIKGDLEKDPNPDIMTGTNLGGFGLMIIPAYANLANGLLSKIAATDKKILVTFKEDGTLIPYNTSDWTQHIATEDPLTQTSSAVQQELERNDYVERVWGKLAEENAPNLNKGATDESKITDKANSNQGVTDKKNSKTGFTNEENLDKGVTADSNMPDKKEDEENSNEGEPGQNED